MRSGVIRSHVGIFNIQSVGSMCIITAIHNLEKCDTKCWAIADLSDTPLTLFIIWTPLLNLLLQHFQNTVPCFFHQSFMECVGIHFRFGDPLIPNAMSIARFISAIIVKYGTWSRATGGPPYIARSNWPWFQFIKIVIPPKLKKSPFYMRESFHRTPAWGYEQYPYKFAPN